MKATTLSILTIAIVSGLLGCGQSRDRDEAAPAQDMMVPSAPGGGAMVSPEPTAAAAPDAGTADMGISSSAAVVSGRDSTRKFVRTADLKFRAANAIRTTYDVEDIVNRFDGFVTSSRLNSNIDDQTTIPISADSSLETTYYTVTSTMVVRVPNIRLDSTLKAIAPLVDFLDYRVVTADDIGLSMLSNQLAQRRLGTHQQRLSRAIDAKGGKLEETVSAEENLLDKQASTDEALLANLSLQDQVEFSRVNLTIYQRQSFRRDVIPNDKNIEAYEPSFGTKVIDGLEVGWVGLVFVLVLLAKLWAPILFGIVVYIVYRMIKRKGGQE